MKKNIFTLMAVALLYAGLTACGGSGNKPFKDLVDYYLDFAEEIANNPDKAFTKSDAQALEEKEKKLLGELEEKTILVELNDGLGYELSSDQGKIKDVILRGGLFQCSIVAEGKNVDNGGANTLMGVLYDDEGNEVHAYTIDVKHNKENNDVKLWYNVSVKPQGIYLFGDVTKLVIMKMDAQRRDEINKKSSERLNTLINKLQGKYSDNKDKSESNDTSDANDGATIFDNGKLGPVEVGKSMPNIPQKVDGLYDKFTHKKEEHEDEMDGAWTEEYYLFLKDGKEIFRANIYEGKVYTIRLLSGSSFIKTSDGISVGSSARELFNKVRMEWGTYYEGETFGTNGHFTYYVSSDDLIQTDIPQKAEHFKPEAKVCGIVYQ